MFRAMAPRSLTLIALVLAASTAFAQGDDEWGDEEWGDDEAILEGEAAPLPPVPPSPAPDEATLEGEAAPLPPAQPSPAPEAPAGEPPAPGAAPLAPAPPEGGPAALAAPATVPPPPAPSPPYDEDDDDLAVRGTSERQVGDPVPLTQREPLLPQLGVEVSLRYGLVGSGPTRFVNDIRFGVFDWLEVRTALGPYPSSLMGRLSLGRQQGPFGALLVEGGLAHFDAGLRLAPDAGEAEVGIRLHWEASVAYTKAFAERFNVYSAARYRARQSFLADDNQYAFAVEGALTYDLLPWIALTGGVGYAQVIGTPVREIAVNFVEVDRPGMGHFLVRDDGVGQSLTVPLALTYGRVESFDVDLFITPRIWPQFDVIFGAGVRWRTWFGRKPWEART
jgi:hypothetical protein